MMYIYYCEDLIEHYEHFRKIVDEISEDAQMEITMDFFDNAEALLSCLTDKILRKEKVPDIIFADIKMPGMDGIELGKELQKIAPEVCLVLLTAYEEYAIEGYETRAYRYLLKPASKEKIAKILIEIYHKKNKEKYFVVKGIEADTLVQLIEITYISAEDKYTIIHAGDKEYLDRRSLQFYEEELKEVGFFRIHRKYIVNMRCHKVIDKGKVILGDGVMLPISRRRETAYREQLLKLLERGRLK